MDLWQAIVLRDSGSMKLFADGEPTFIYGEWKEWKAACEIQGRTIPPSEFKINYPRHKHPTTPV